ncbi:hypothetical protein F5Y16DRAFT_207859 [Xylariaceae sp. FL0255]|nr:hypothetical protein F5Y16DRAFT_207859 [Xylariaceae sp. FL0255]
MSTASAAGSLSPQPEPVCHIVTPVGMLGFGLDEVATHQALAALVPTGVPTALILDSGSTDGGPWKLATPGAMSCPRSAYVRDLTKLLRLQHAFRVPLLVGSIGGSGTDLLVDEFVGILEEIAAMEGNEDYRLKTIAIKSGISKPLILDRLRSNAISGCGPCVPTLTDEDITEPPCVVAQIGPEPFLDAMKAHPDFNIVLGGRAYDPAPYIAFAAYVSGVPLDHRSDGDQEVRRRQVGGFTHMGKIMECGGFCAEPKSPGAIATVFRNGAFDIAPLDVEARCTTTSVVAHTLYEKTRPDILHGPGGYLDLNSTAYEQLGDGRTVRVYGSTFHWSREEDGGKGQYQVKLEAARVVGERSMVMGSFKDPTLITQLDSVVKRIKMYATQQHSGGGWELEFHYYGRSNEPYDPESGVPIPEVFIIGEVLASTQEQASSIANSVKVACTHISYSGQKATSGNFAWGIGGKSAIDLGPCPNFCVYHLMDLQDGEERLDLAEGSGGNKALFTSRTVVIGRGTPNADGAPSNAPPPPSRKEDDKPRASQGGKAAIVPEGGPKAQVPTGSLGDVARVLRSKNAGPYEITFDIMFDTEEEYSIIKESGVLSAKTSVEILGLESESDIVWCGWFDPARAFKVTVPRTLPGDKKTWIAGGGFMENDVHGALLYLPFLYYMLPKEVLAKLGRA